VQLEIKDLSSYITNTNLTHQSAYDPTRVSQLFIKIYK